MEAEAAKLLGAGLAAVGAGLASLGVGNVFAKYLEGALRNPGAADGQQGRLFIGFAAAVLARDVLPRHADNTDEEHLGRIANVGGGVRGIKIGKDRV